MSSFVYGIVTANRTAAPAGTSRDTAAPAMGTYIDTLAALVPAEALALYASIVVPNATNVVSVNGKSATVISDPNLLSWSCAGLLVLSSLLYFVGRKKTNLSGWDALRFLIPPAAFAAWMLLANPGVWDVWWHGSTTAARVVIAAFAAVVLGIVASALGYQADQAPGTLSVTGVNPDKGSAAGGESVTLTGSGFTGATGVSFDTVPASGLAIASDTQLTVTSPAANASKIVDVTVTTPKGTSATSAADQFTYDTAAAAAPIVATAAARVVTAAAAPSVTRITPDRGPTAGGDSVTLTGSGFTGATGVSFGTVPASGLAIASDTQLTVTSPAANASKIVDVTVTTPKGTSATSAADQFTYFNVGA